MFSLHLVKKSKIIVNVQVQHDMQTFHKIMHMDHNIIYDSTCICIIGASLSELRTNRTAVQNPPDIYIYIYMPSVRRLRPNN